jgi:hypothetical protein
MRSWRVGHGHGGDWEEESSLGEGGASLRRFRNRHLQTLLDAGAGERFAGAIGENWSVQCQIDPSEPGPQASREPLRADGRRKQ